MKISRELIWDYFILAARILLAVIFFGYGLGKIRGEMFFNVSPEVLSMPVKSVSLFNLSFYLFSHEPFRSFIGISQIIASLLLLYNRTFIIGALILLPILINVLIVDIAFVKMEPFYWRLSYYVLLDLMILWHQKARILIAIKNITSGLTTNYKYPIWAYLILPIFAIGLECLSGVVRTLCHSLFALF